MSRWPNALRHAAPHDLPQGLGYEPARTIVDHPYQKHREVETTAEDALPICALCALCG